MIKIGIASDHGGYDLKQQIIGEFTSTFEIIDFGCENSKDSVDYPDYISKVCHAVSNEEIEWGIAICGTGIGASIVANRFEKIRAALCHNQFTGQMARAHNDSNMLVLGARVLGPGLVFSIIHTFANTAFEGGRHESRLNKINHCSTNK